MKMSNYTRPRQKKPGSLVSFCRLFFYFSLGPRVGLIFATYGRLLWRLVAQLRALCIYDYFPFYFIY